MLHGRLSLATVLALASGTVAQVDQVVPNAYSGVVGTGSFLGPIANAARTYQLLINADQLTGLVGTDLTSLTFRLPGAATAAYPAATAIFSSYDIRISPSVDPALRSLMFASNVAGPAVLVRSGPLVIPAGSFTSGSSPNAFGYTIAFSPYTYTGGHLLVEIRHTGSNSTSQSADSILTSTAGYGTSVSACWTGSYTGTLGSAGNFAVTKLSGTTPGTTGACCLGAPTFACLVTSAAACSASGGTYAGDGVTCAAANCPAAPTGGCCFANGSCQLLSQFDCTNQGGNYAGDGVSCAAANCPQPGACCMPNYVCSVMLPAACTTAGGTYQGPASVCGTCPTPPAGSVAIYAATSSTDVTDVQNKLVATGLFPAVVTRVITSPAATPTLADLQQFDAVLVWSNLSFTSGDAMGNVLADYVDAGGGVVNAIFVLTTTTANRFLGGRWDSTYQIVPQGLGTTTATQQTLGTIVIPGHPIMNGVNTLVGGNTTTTRPTTTTLTPHGVLVAQWTDGKTLVAVSNTRPNRVDLGMYPPSTTANSTGWVATSDGGRLMANALLYAGGNLGGGCYANCDGSTGSPALTANDFQCFVNKFAGNDSYANCDGSTGTPALTANDFQCFINKFAGGCS